MTLFASGSRDRAWVSIFAKSLIYWDTFFTAMGRSVQGVEWSMCKDLRSWWRDKYIYRSKTVPMMTKCKRVHSHIYSTVLNARTGCSATR